MRTSISHPLQTACVQPFVGSGRIGITFCPGKVQPVAMSDSWQRDLGLDLDVISKWEDVVEVSPTYDPTANTAPVAAQVLFEIVSLLRAP